MRSTLGISRDTRVVLCGVGPDTGIERYWSDRRIMDLAPRLARLGLSLAVPPNYSVWDDDPRTQHIYNRKRSLIIGNEWTKAGLPVAPYIVGTRDRDWQFWADVLASNPQLTHIVKEFQTGLSKCPQRAREALDRAAALQQQVGRELHLVAVGGYRWRSMIHNRFEGRWTIVDSTPFMRAVHRRGSVKSGSKGGKWRTALGEQPADLFGHNVRERAEELEEWELEADRLHDEDVAWSWSSPDGPARAADVDEFRVE